MICPTCNTVNREDAKFCKGCGKRLTVEMAPSVTTAATTATTASGPTHPVEPDTQSTVEATVPASLAPAESETASTEQAPLKVTVEEIEDISQAPTQILTPEQMVAFNARRWQQEAEQARAASAVNGQPPTEREQEQAAQMSDTRQAPAAEASRDDIQTNTAQNTTEDIADMPTVIITPHNEEEEPIPIPPPPPPSPPTPEATTEAPTAQEHGQPAGESETATTTPEVEGETTQAAAQAGEGSDPQEEQEGEEPREAQKDEHGAAHAPEPKEEAGQPNPADTSEQAEQPEEREAPPAFAALAVGAVVDGRYEISGVVSAGESENTYQVIDRQGYQKCWNCGSTQNAEGDEFCIDCGAELLNIPYVMHEYSSEQGQQEEAAVLQGAIVNTFVDNGRTYAIEQPLVEQNAFPTGVHLQVATDSDAGNVRRSEPNEDSTLALLLERVHESISMPVGVFIVADGLGGHDNGQLASRVAINVIAERTVRDLLAGPLADEKAGGESAKPTNLDEDAAVSLLHGAVADANDVLVQMNQKDKTDMGSTLTGFMIVGDTAYIVNVGDSRTYMVRGGKIYQLTTDHSLVGQLVAGGLIQPEDVYTHPQRSQIFRSLGDKHNVQIDIFKQQLHPGDILLSCSDGLWEMVRNPQIESILTQAPNPQVACTQLIEAANANGGEDNVSAVVVFVS
ncbi:MAG TPA: protein phosphatase 2C domain-containing protein [Ktedonobacteraceae bacterium]|nr:protein phosphatase 2C domain-containing protein [Ktedonobacteraceae bacterium]